MQKKTEVCFLEDGKQESIGIHNNRHCIHLIETMLYVINKNDDRKLFEVLNRASFNGLKYDEYLVKTTERGI